MRLPATLPTPITTPSVDNVPLVEEVDQSTDDSPNSNIALPSPISPSPASAQPKLEINALNKAFYARISARKDILLTQTDLVGTFCFRMVFGVTRTEEKHVQEAFNLLVKEAEATLNEWRERINNI